MAHNFSRFVISSLGGRETVFYSWIKLTFYALVLGFGRFKGQASESKNWILKTDEKSHLRFVEIYWSFNVNFIGHNYEISRSNSMRLFKLMAATKNNVSIS